MLRSLQTAATGMDAQQSQIDVLSNNIANVNTTAYKENRAVFQDLLYQNIRAPGAASPDGIMEPGGVQVGVGTRLVAIDKDFATLGAVKITNKNTDLMIQGNGFFRVQLKEGIAYTRDGSMQIAADGRLVTPKGHPIIPEIIVPPNAIGFTVAEDGTVTANVRGEDDPRVLGQIQIANFVNPNGLSSIGGNLFNSTKASGEAIVTVAGREGTGVITQGELESSNVNIVNQMVNMITGQRGYELSSKVIKTGDEMLSTANQLKS